MPVRTRAVNYCVHGVSGMDPEDPSTWICSGSNATTIPELKHDLRGEPFIPKKYHALIGEPSSTTGNITWLSETAVQMRNPNLPLQGALKVYVVPIEFAETPSIRSCFGWGKCKRRVS